MQNIYKLSISLLIGCLSGLIGGSLGVSGFEFMLPALLYFHIISDFKKASGTILLTLAAPVSLLAAYEHYQHKQVDISVSIALMISYFIMAFFGASLSQFVSNNILEKMTGFYFLFIAFYFLHKSFCT